MTPRKFTTWAIVPVNGKLDYESFQGMYASKVEAERTIKYNALDDGLLEVVEIEVTELRGAK